MSSDMAEAIRKFWGEVLGRKAARHGGSGASAFYGRPLTAGITPASQPTAMIHPPEGEPGDVQIRYVTHPDLRGDWRIRYDPDIDAAVITQSRPPNPDRRFYLSRSFLQARVSTLTVLAYVVSHLADPYGAESGFELAQVLDDAWGAWLRAAFAIPAPKAAPRPRPDHPIYGDLDPEVGF